MTRHMEIKQKVKSINEKTAFNAILDNSMLSEREKTMMKMYYIEKHDFDFIADTLGYSKIGVLKMHKRVLQKIESLL